MSGSRSRGKTACSGEAGGEAVVDEELDEDVEDDGDEDDEDVEDDGGTGSAAGAGTKIGTAPAGTSEDVCTTSPPTSLEVPEADLGKSTCMEETMRLVLMM